MAYLEGMLCLAHMYRNYDFELLNTDSIMYRPGLTLMMLNGLQVRVKCRR
jgi:cytochrome P450